MPGLLLITAITLLVWSVVDFGGLWLPWNVFLAWVPVLFIPNGTWSKSQALKILLFFFFLPNAAYLVSDLCHLSADHHQGDWLMYGLLSFLGIKLHVFCVRQCSRSMPGKWRGAGAAFLSYATAYGIFLGRFGRLNSWEIASQPCKVFSSIAESCRTMDAFSFVGLWGTVLLGLYWGDLLSNKQITSGNLKAS